MKDITRIHIAKVAYDIELTAKKKLETYILQLEKYAQDEEVIKDIEIRITELLHDRGVKQNDVISSDDVVAIQTQLGDPKEFMADGDIAVGDVIAEVNKKLYRNTDTALVGGVLSGISSYIGINPVWTRLLFVFLTFISFGFTVFIYLLFWFIVPAAKTAAEKLQMGGQAVTLASIRQLNESEATPNASPRIIKRTATILIGLGAVVGAIATTVGTVYAIIALPQVANGRDVRQVLTESIGSTYPLTIGLGIAASVTLIVFLVLIAYAAFKETFVKRIWVTGIVLIVLGLTLAGSAVASGMYGAYERQARIASSMVTKPIVLPKGFDAINVLEVEGVNFGASVQYVVDTKHRAEMTTLRGDTVAISVNGDHATLQYIRDKNMNNTYSQGETRIVIYGPELMAINAKSSSVMLTTGVQDALTVTATNNSRVSVNESRINSLLLELDGNSSFDGQASTLGRIAIVNIAGASSVSLGMVTSLTIQSPVACAANARSEVFATGVNEGFVAYNNAKITKTQHQDGCMTISTDGSRYVNDGIFDEYGNRQ